MTHFNAFKFYLLGWPDSPRTFFKCLFLENIHLAIYTVYTCLLGVKCEREVLFSINSHIFILVPLFLTMPVQGHMVLVSPKNQPPAFRQGEGGQADHLLSCAPDEFCFLGSIVFQFQGLPGLACWECHHLLTFPFSS